MEMLKSPVIQTFCKRNHINLNSNKSTKDIKTCNVANGESEQYETLIELFSNSDELCQSMKTGESNVASGKTLRNVVCFDKIQEKKILQFACGVSDVHENKSTATDLQRICSTIADVINETVPARSISEPIRATGFINEIPDLTGCISETTRDTGFSSEASNSIEFRSTTTDATGFISGTTGDTGYRLCTTDTTGFIIEKIEEIGFSCKTTTSKINSPLTEASSISKGFHTTVKIPVLRYETSEFIEEDSVVTKFRNEAVEIKEIEKDIAQFKEINQETSFNSCISGIDTCHPQISSEDFSIAEITVKGENTAKGIFTGDDYSIHSKETCSISETTNEPMDKSLIKEEQSLHSEEMSHNYETINCPKQLYDIEKFLEAITLTNKDMVKKSSILLQKQTLVSEVLSYVHAIQSVLRLSKLRHTFPKDMAGENRDNVAMSSNMRFYEAGETILEELKLYKGELKSDFRDWETFRLEILQITERIPYEFELCDNEATARMLMHEITTEICTILKNMEIITSKREERNEECIDLMDSIDTYVRYSSAFIMEKNYFNLY